MRIAATAAASLALAGCGGAGPASEPASQAPARASVLAYVWDGRPLLVRVDPVTLRARSRPLDVGNPPISAWARSPGGGRVALGSGDGGRLTFADLGRMRRVSTFDLGPKGYVAGLAWPSTRRVVAALSGTRVEIVVVDPDARRVVRRYRLPGTVTRSARFRGGLVLLLSPPDRIGPATLAVATPSGLRKVTLPLKTGVDPPSVFEPGLAVSPGGRRAIVVAAGARVVDVDLRTLAVAERELSEPVSMLGRLRAWLDPAALAKGPLDGPVRSAAWMGGSRIVVAGWDYRPTGQWTTVAGAAGVRLIDERNWSVRTLAEGASAAVVSGDTVLAFGGTQGPSGLHGIGLRGFGPDGRERFHLFRDRFVAVVTAVGRYAYVSEQAETETRIEVIDLASGRVVRTVRRATYMDVLRLD